MDMEQLVDAVTKAIMQRLNDTGPKVAVFGDIPDGLLCEGAQRKQGATRADIEGCDYVIMTAESFRAAHGCAAQPVPAGPCAEPGKRIINLTGKRLIHERDLRDENAQSGDVVRVGKNAIVTALAHDYAKGIGAKISRD